MSELFPSPPSPASQKLQRRREGDPKQEDAILEDKVTVGENEKKRLFRLVIIQLLLLFSIMLHLNDFFVSRVKGERMEIVSNFPKRLFPHLWDDGANWTVASSSMLPLPFNERRRRRRRRAFSPLFPRGHYHYVHHHHLLMGKASGGMAERKFIRARFPCAMCKVDKL